MTRVIRYVFRLCLKQARKTCGLLLSLQHTHRLHGHYHTTAYVATKHNRTHFAQLFPVAAIRIDLQSCIRTQVKLFAENQAIALLVLFSTTILTIRYQKVEKRVKIKPE